VTGPFGAGRTVAASHGKEVTQMHATIFKTLPIFSLVTAVALALAFAPLGVTMPELNCPPYC
jgi:hypothetical protein